MKNYSDFILNENITSNISDGEIATLFPGRFQPFHLGHLKMIEYAYQHTKSKVVIMQIISKNNKKSVFPKEVLDEINNRIKSNYNNILLDILEFNSVKYGNVPFIGYQIEQLRDNGYEANTICCGEDRESSYSGQMKYLIKKSELDKANKDKDLIIVNDKFNLITIPRFENPDNIEYSGTKVRESLKNNDEELYKKLVPECLYDMFNELKNIFKNGKIQ